MAELKTQKTKQDPKDYINSITPESKKRDAQIIFDLCKKATKQKPVLWSSSMVGFGEYTYRRKNDKIDRKWMKIGFSARKANFAVHILSGLDEEQKLLDKLGKYKRGVSCLYITKLADIDLKILENLVEKGYNKSVFIGQC